MVICSKNNLDKIKSMDIQGKITILTPEDYFCQEMASDHESAVLQIPSYYDKLSTNMNDTLVIFWSSGTTGRALVCISVVKSLRQFVSVCDKL